ncbi:MAG TPA: acetate--CoA ligase family protein [Chloroflexota bacterium]|nr:acetate--CoA ligase family protein [Chloroflexota bacterium]
MTSRELRVASRESEEPSVGGSHSLLATRDSRLDRLLRPESVAVVGASPNPSFVSGILKNVLRYGYEGSVVAVNPRYDQILEAPCYPSLLEVPHPVDLVVVGVAHRLIPSVLDQAEQKGVAALCIVSSGFSEMGGEEGARRQAELGAWAERTGIVVNGPNCLGLMNAPIGMVALPSTFEELIAGEVGAILQSGMMAPSVLVPLLTRGIGLTIGVTTGNEADLEAADYIRYCAEDEQTRVIACYTEQIKTPGRFIAACELAAERQKPIVMLKIGRSEASRRVALAHTGSLVGSDDVIDAVLRKLGVSRVYSVDELLEAVAVFHTRKLARGGGVALISVSGGAASLVTDLAPDCGITLPALPEETERKLRQIVPEYGSVGNPLDITGQGVFETEILREAFDALAEAGNLDVIVYGRGFPSRLDRQTPVGQIVEAAVANHPEIVFLVMSLVGGHLHPSQNPDIPVVDPIDRLDGVPFLQGGEYGLKAVAALVRYAAFQRERARAEPNPPGPPSLKGRGERAHPLPFREGGREQVRFAGVRLTAAAQQARALVHAAGGRPMTERESKQVLALYGIRTTRERLATSADEALAAAGEIGYPVALKAESADLLHKTEAGALLLDVRDAEALADGFERVLANARGAAPKAELRGVLVQEMAQPGVEVILGMSQDAQFGPVMACGLGGVFVETLEDVQLLLPRVSATEARSALERLRAYPVLLGTRGKPGADLDALVDTMLRFSELCLDLGDLVREIDVNPLVVGPRVQGVCAVDCLIVPNGD